MHWRHVLRQPISFQPLPHITSAATSVSGRCQRSILSIPLLMTVVDIHPPTRHSIVSVHSAPTLAGRPPSVLRSCAITVLSFRINYKTFAGPKTTFKPPRLNASHTFHSSVRSPLIWVSKLSLVRLHKRQLFELSFKLVATASQHSTGEAALLSKSSDGHDLAIAFSWSKIPPGVLVVSSQPSIHTNILAFDDQGLLSEHAHQAHLMSLLHATNWQTKLCQGLRS